MRWLYPSLLWRKAGGTNTIYLTFDDGPIPEVTPFVLETLSKYNAKGTFFCIGDNIRKHPDVFEQVKQEGHQLGNHTYNHLKGWVTDDDRYIENYKQCQRLVGSVFFRPPYGRIKRSQIAKLQALDPAITIVMWDVLSGDFDHKLDPEKCLENVLAKTRAGSVVVFHDSIKAFPRLKYVLPRALAYWQKRGYRFETL